jgi:hypothetical protein
MRTEQVGLCPTVPEGWALLDPSPSVPGSRSAHPPGAEGAGPCTFVPWWRSRRSWSKQLLLWPLLGSTVLLEVSGLLCSPCPHWGPQTENGRMQGCTRDLPVPLPHPLLGWAQTQSGASATTFCHWWPSRQGHEGHLPASKDEDACCRPSSKDGGCTTGQDTWAGHDLELSDSRASI